jgi:GTP pyrophosphokinase
MLETIRLLFPFGGFILMQKAFCSLDSFCSDMASSRACLKMLLELVRKNNGSVEKRLLEKAFFFSRGAHKGQLRASKRPYFIHPFETAVILADMGLSSKVVAAGLLHDVLEDTPVTKARFKKMFGKEVFSLVEGVTKFKMLANETKQQSNFKSLHNLLFATTKDPRVILIKLADKLHNLRTIQYLKPKDRKRIASEALAIYVPIAHKIGMMQIASELEDLAFRHAKPETFKRFEARLNSLEREKLRNIDLMVPVLMKKLPKAEFYKQKRSVYSIYSKMQNTGKVLDEVHDTIILNIVVSDEEECYCALGIVHGLFPPLPNKVKDFIASPKPSFYRVLQTTVFGPKENPVKIRISTGEMDALNRYGVVAYRRLFGKRLSKYMKQNLSKLGLLLGNGESKTSFFDALKADFLKRPVYVFNSRGKLVELPKGSTVLDFAFATEKNWALHVSKAKVNGKEAGLGRRLDFGNIIDLSFSKKKRVKKGWLNKAKTFIAKEEILKALKKKH